MLKGLVGSFIEPKTKNEDLYRRELIFNILVGLIILVVCLAMVSSGITKLLLADPVRTENSAAPHIFLMIELVFFLLLYALSRKGLFIVSSYVFLFVLYFLGCFMWYQWGVDVVVGILTQAIVIVIAGILIHSRAGLWATAIVGTTMFVVGGMQQSGAIEVNSFWRLEDWSFMDTVVVVIILCVIAVVTWLSNREIDRSLRRARKSEALLKQERDMLEITVEKRTSELKESQVEKLTQLYRFAEFGRLSAGIFHDLINPLTAISLNIQKVRGGSGKDTGEANSISNENTNLDMSGNDRKANAVDSIASSKYILSIEDMAKYADEAMMATRKMEDMVAAVRKQLSRQENNTMFSLHDEIMQVRTIMMHSAIKSNVEISVTGRKDIWTFGDAIKFNQIVLNLLANAIDSYRDIKEIGMKSDEPSWPLKRVLVNLDLREGEKGSEAVISVTDKGTGIAEEHVKNLFNPFFTTKSKHHGIGLGLSMVKRIVEHDFSGKIEVNSCVGGDKDAGEHGSTFTATFPIKKDEEKNEGGRQEGK
jgi:signal transduction histidine kinase